MNNSHSSDEQGKIEKYVAEIRNLYAEGNLANVLWMLDVFKSVPEEIHEIAVNALIQTVGVSPSYYQVGLKFLTWKKHALPLNNTNRERLLSAILDIAADPERQDYIIEDLRELSQIDDPRAFEAIVKIYKNDKLPEGKQQVVYALGTNGQENALPILLDYCFRQMGDLSDDEINLLEQYSVSEKIDLTHSMDVDDRDKVIAKFIQQLQSETDCDDFLRQAIAYTLAILYLSDIT
jgi:hypothetical protein